MIGLAYCLRLDLESKFSHRTLLHSIFFDAVVRGATNEHLVVVASDDIWGQVVYVLLIFTTCGALHDLRIGVLVEGPIELHQVPRLILHVVFGPDDLLSIHVCG